MADLILGSYAGTSACEFVGGPLDGEVFRLPPDALRVFRVVEAEEWRGAYVTSGRCIYLNWDNRTGEDEPYRYYAERHAGRYLRWTDQIARWHPYA